MNGCNTAFTPPPCNSCAKVPNYYGPSAYCSLDNAVACTYHIHGELVRDRGIQCPNIPKIRREENCFAGGGCHGSPFAQPPPPSPSLVAVPGGGFGLGLPYLPCRGGGGVRPQHTWLKMIPTLS